MVDSWFEQLKKAGIEPKKKHKIGRATADYAYPAEKLAILINPTDKAIKLIESSGWKTIQFAKKELKDDPLNVYYQIKYLKERSELSELTNRISSLKAAVDRPYRPLKKKAKLPRKPIFTTKNQRMLLRFILILMLISGIVLILYHFFFT